MADITSDRLAVIGLFRRHFGVGPATVVPLAGAGSNRRYYRMTRSDGHTVVATVGTDPDENRAFVALCRHFNRLGLPVPRLLAVDEQRMAYLQEDLGDLSLFDAISGGRATGKFSDDERSLLAGAMRLLARFHDDAPEGIDWSVCYPQERFDSRMVRWDLNYFKYCFLKASGMEFREDLLQDDLDLLEQRLMEACVEGSMTFMVRDFQSRNVMVSPDSTLRLIDFQGGRRGPAEYDVASFLWQAKANLPDDLRRDLVDVYLDARGGGLTVEAREEFLRRLPLFVLFRMLQVLGAYGFRGWMERKPHFLESIPGALRNAVALFDDDMKRDFPALYALLVKELELQVALPAAPAEGLTVRVTSFSFKKGVPRDPTGNGGGYVFDCRATHNPGRYDPYKMLTGMDDEVIRFLEDDGEILPFISHAEALVDASVERYLKRGFSSLCVNFGCTGGQHRSVYSAETMARHLNDKYGVRVILCHREQGVEKEFPCKDVEVEFDSYLK